MTRRAWSCTPRRSSWSRPASESRWGQQGGGCQYRPGAGHDLDRFDVTVVPSHIDGVGSVNEPLQFQGAVDGGAGQGAQQHVEVRVLEGVEVERLNADEGTCGVGQRHLDPLVRLGDGRAGAYAARPLGRVEAVVVEVVGQRLRERSGRDRKRRCYETRSLRLRRLANDRPTNEATHGSLPEMRPRSSDALLLLTFCCSMRKVGSDGSLTSPGNALKLHDDLANLSFREFGEPIRFASPAVGLHPRACVPHGRERCPPASP